MGSRRNKRYFLIFIIIIFYFLFFIFKIVVPSRVLLSFWKLAIQLFYQFKIQKKKESNSLVQRVFQGGT